MASTAPATRNNLATFKKQPKTHEWNWANYPKPTQISLFFETKRAKFSVRILLIKCWKKVFFEGKGKEKQRNERPGHIFDAAFSLSILFFLSGIGIVFFEAQKLAEICLFRALLLPILVDINLKRWYWCRWKFIIILTICNNINFLKARSEIEIDPKW